MATSLSLELFDFYPKLPFQVSSLAKAPTALHLGDLLALLFPRDCHHICYISFCEHLGVIIIYAHQFVLSQKLFDIVEGLSFIPGLQGVIVHLRGA